MLRMSTLRRLIAACALALAVLVPLAAAAQEQVRVALVIGNSDYQSSRVKDLKNPRNDAEDVARALRGFGFEVDLRLDLAREEMAAAMQGFAGIAQTADVALFYYAGHGMQLDLRNYLVPVDAEFRSADDVVNRNVPLDSLTSATEGMKGSLLIFIDACQENPLGQRDGLARIPVSANQFVALAALPDMKAADGVGRNSPFTEAFITNAGVPGRSISDVMLEVRLDVLATTGSQVPWDNSSLTQQIVFVPGEQQALGPETMLWRTASSLGDTSLLAAYLERFPDGPHADDARILMASVEPSELAMRAVSPDAVGPSGGEEALWQLASSSRWPPLLEVYVSRYPTGAHVEEANELLAILPKPNAAETAELTCERLATHPADETPQFPGVPGTRLRQNAAQAIEACRAAHEAHPEIHKYTTFLARALFVGGRMDEGLALYREAAEAGNIRALTTLGGLYETGAGVPADLPTAVSYYERAAAAGAPDATVNLAGILAQGRGVPRDIDRAIDLLKRASDAGSEEAAYNLGVLALLDQGVPPAEARTWFALASDRGYVGGHSRAALLFETDELGPRDPPRTVEYLLRAVASDEGSMLGWLQNREVTLGSDTVSVLQRRLSDLKMYTGPVDGQFGPKTLEALRTYRFGGLIPPSLMGG